MSLQPPPARPPRNQRKFLAVGRGAAKRRPSPWPEEREEGALLDGFALLDACQVEEPEEAVQAVLEGCGLSSAVASDFAFFTQLTHLDLGDNRLQLGQLAGLPALLELHLDCNGVRSVALPSGGFARLEVLNLAYNALTVDAVASLAQLPCLRELDLTANQLNALPADWASFLELRRLVLDRNELGADEDLIALGTTPYLKGPRERSGAARLLRRRSAAAAPLTRPGARHCASQSYRAAPAAIARRALARFQPL